ncbi:MAG: WG repeat-containing protein [Candidatus Melainabacteria bacterium]|nr:MAG: WG repeat-containing protein [Candidatus Melainabacteria bacterium]
MKVDIRKLNLCIISSVFTLVCASQTEALEQVPAKKKSNSVEMLNPTASMPMWFYEQARDFRFPIPAHFDFIYIDKMGKEVISGPFGHASDFAGGIALVDVKSLELLNGEWKVTTSPFEKNIQAIGLDGTVQDKYHQPPLHTFIDEFVLIPLPHAHDANYALVDKDWKEVSRLKAKTLGVYSGGLISSQDDETQKWGYVDKDGKQVIKPIYTEAKRFSEGLAGVRGDRPAIDHSAMQNLREKYKHVKTPTPELIEEATKQMRAATIAMNAPAKIQFIDTTGKSVIPAQFTHAREFHEGFAAVKKDGKWGFIDKSGATIIPFDYEWTDDFYKTSNGKIAAVEKNGKVGFIDSNNKTILPFEYADARSFSEDLAPATIDGKLWGFIDLSGKFMIEPKFMRANKFNNGRALVYSNERKDFGKRKEDAQFLFLTGKDALDHKDINKAVTAFNAAIKLAPGTPPAKKSRYYLESATPQKPVANDIVSMLREVEMTEAIGRHKDAQALLDKCFSQAPHSEWVAIKMSHSKINEGKTEEARKILDNMVEVNNKYAPTYIHLARVAFANGDEKEAKRLIEKAHELNPYSDLVKLYYPFSPTKMKLPSSP